MKKSQLQQIIKEEIQKILKEGNVFPMWEEEGSKQTTFYFGYDLENIKAVEEYLEEKYEDINPKPYEMIIARGEDVMNALRINPENTEIMADAESGELHTLINNCEGKGNYDEGDFDDVDDDDLNESIKHFQKLAGIITEEYGVSKEAKSNDYYKKGMMSEEDSENFAKWQDSRNKPHIRLQMLIKAGIYGKKAKQIAMDDKYKDMSWDDIKKMIPKK